MLTKIVCAATKVEVNGIAIIIPGVRHYDKVMRELLKAITDDGFKEIEQGFLSNRGDFLTRQEAWSMAVENNQVLKLVGNQSSLQVPNKLYSENLY